MSANKLTAGTIDTTIITVAGSDGHLRISDNTIQIKDLQRVRVQIGKDASGEYSLSVWDKAGKLIWDALGATESTIQRKIIRDKMVADDAAINALKLDLKSFNTALTEQGVSISGTVVQVGNKTLNVELTEQRQLTTEHGETLTDHAARITANENAVKLKVSTQEYESYKTTVNGEIATTKSRLNAAESSISVMKDQIALKVEQTDIEEAVNNIQLGGRNLLRNSTFNEGLKYWAARSEYATVVREGRNGENCLKQVGKLRTDSTITHSTVFPVKTGESYALSGWAKSANVVKGTTNYFVGLYASFYGADDEWKAQESILSGDMPLTDDWERKVLTFQVPNVAGITKMRISIFARDFTGTIWWDDIQLETGNKATDWSLAIEDIAEDIAEVDGKFVNYSTTVQMNAAITAAKDSITSTVSRTYATRTEVSSVSGKVTSLESWKQEASQKITKDGILSTVGDYYATSKYVETLKTGSRNFLRNGNFAKNNYHEQFQQAS